MIECARCETARWVQIVESRMTYHGCQIIEVREVYECQHCGARGELKSNDHATLIDGEIRDNQRRPEVSL